MVMASAFMPAAVSTISLAILHAGMDRGRGDSHPSYLAAWAESDP